MTEDWDATAGLTPTYNPRLNAEGKDVLRMPQGS